MPRDIPRISIPSNIIRTLPPPAVDVVPPPITTELTPPVIDVPSPVIEYPTIDMPTREEFEGMVTPPSEQQQPETTQDTRDLPPPAPPAPPLPQPEPPVPQPTVDVPGVGPVPLPEAAPLITAGTTAVVAAAATMTATILFSQVKDKLLAPLIERISKTKKIKIKQKKPVLHFVEAENGVQIFEYTVKGTRLKDSTENIEQYLRDTIDIDSLYEFDNKIIIDDDLKNRFTKEGQKRFKKHFCPPQSIVKKLSARISV